MIPDFRTYIGESVWGDIHKRSSGIQVRKEDNPYGGRDIDSLSGEEFCDYLTYRYEILESDIMDSMYSSSISVPLYLFSGYTHLFITYFDTNKDKIVEVSIVNLTPRLPAGLYKKLSERFDLEYNKKFKITNFLPQDGKYTNSYCLEIIDFILENTDCQVLMKKKEIVSESVWGDIHKRSNGIQVRKEDDVDLLDIWGLCDYLNNRYEMKSKYDIQILNAVNNSDEGTISVCLYEDESGYYRYLYYYTSIVTQADVFDSLKCVHEANQKYSLKFNHEHDVESVSIYPKDKSVPLTNSFFIEVLDFILDKIQPPLKKEIERKTDMNESVWGDIHKRSSGIQVRKEDDANNKDIQEFVDYLNELYDADVRKVKTAVNSETHQNVMVTILRTKGKAVFGGWPIGLILRDYYGEKTIIFSNKSFPIMCPKLYHKLEDVLTLDIDENDTVNVLSDKGKITNQFFIDVLNTIIDNLDENEEDILITKNEKLSESIWADIHKRSSGVQVKKEDLMNDIYNHIITNYKVSYVNMDEIVYRNEWVHIPICKILGLNSFITIEIHKDYVSFSSIDVNKYKSSRFRIFINPIKDNLNILYDEIKEKYSPEISTFDGMDHWITFKMTPPSGTISKEFCDEIINFIMDNLNDNKLILKILEKK